MDAILHTYLSCGIYRCNNLDSENYIFFTIGSVCAIVLLFHPNLNVADGINSAE